MTAAPSPLPSLREAMTATFRNWRSIAVALVLPPVLAVAAAYTVTPQYDAEAKVLVKSGREFLPQSDGGRTSNNAPTTSMQEAVNSEIEILTSRDLLLEVLRQVGPADLYPKLAASPPRRGTVEDAALEMLVKSLVVGAVKLSNVIELRLRHEDPDMAARVANQILDSLYNRHITAFSAPRSRLLEEQITSISEKLAVLETERSDFKRANNVFSVSEQRAALITQRERVLVDLREAEARQRELADQIAFLTEELNRTPKTLTLQVDNNDSAVADQAHNRLMELRQKEKELLARYTEDAPPVRNIRSTIAATEKVTAGLQDQRAHVRTGRNPIVDQLELQMVNARTALVPIEGRVIALRDTLQESEFKLRSMESAELKLRDLDRQIANLDQDSSGLRGALEDARLNERLDRANVASITVIEQAHVLPIPVFPKKWQFALVGAALGMFGAGLMVLVSLSFRTTFITAETVERLLGLPVVGAVPRSAIFAQPPARTRTA